MVNAVSLIVAGAFIVPPREIVIFALQSQVHAVFPPNVPPLLTVTAPLAVHIPVDGVHVPVILDVPLTVIFDGPPYCDVFVSSPDVIMRFPTVSVYTVPVERQATPLLPVVVSVMLLYIVQLP
ncbi:Uncharacterised protein [uncultured archaeon]|nr:Uncharacterised protein [uncultured archaeon]